VKVKFTRLLVAIPLVLFVQGAQAALITFTANNSNSYDAYVQQTEPNTAHDYSASGGYGTNAVIEVDAHMGGGGNSEAQGLLQFLNIIGAGAGQIEAGSTINSATLRLWYVNDNSNNNVDFYRMTSNWNESVTWNSLGGGINAANADLTTGITTQLGGNIDPASVSIDVTSFVTSWVEGGMANYGWGIINSSNNGLQFASSENTSGTAGWHTPILEVDYTAPTAVPEPGTVILMCIGLSGIAGRYRRKRTC